MSNTRIFVACLASSVLTALIVGATFASVARAQEAAPQAVCVSSFPLEKGDKSMTPAFERTLNQQLAAGRKTFLATNVNGLATLCAW